MPTGYFSTRENPYNNWNAALGKTIGAFASKHEDVTVLLYSSHATFTKILANPEKYDFRSADARRAASSVWVDQLHPTSKVHRIVAQEVAEFLGTVGIN